MANKIIATVPITGTVAIAMMENIAVVPQYLFSIWFTQYDIHEFCYVGNRD